MVSGQHHQGIYFTLSFSLFGGGGRQIYSMIWAELDVCPAVVRVLMGQGVLTLWMKGPQSEYLKEVGIK